MQTIFVTMQEKNPTNKMERQSETILWVSFAQTFHSIAVDMHVIVPFQGFIELQGMPLGSVRDSEATSKGVSQFDHTVASQEIELMSSEEEGGEEEDEGEEEEKQQKSEERSRLGFGILSAGIGLFLLVVVLPEHIEEVPSSHQRYLDSGGLGAAIWGPLCMLITLQIFTNKTAEMVARGLADDSRGTSEEDVKAVFGTYEEVSSCSKLLSPFGRLAQFLGMIAQLILNVSFITENFLSLPKRDPEQLGNMARHIVAWVETPMMGIMAFFCLLFLLCKLGPAASRGLALKLLLRELAHFSVLQSLPMANPMTTMRRITEIKKARGYAAAAAQGLVFAVMVPAAVMSVLVKLIQVDFATHKLVYEWSYGEYLAFAGFINNLAGLRGDVAAVQQEAIFKFLSSSDPKDFSDRWNGKLLSTLYQVYGFGLGFVLHCTLSVEDLCRLLNPENRKDQLEHSGYKEVPQP